MQERLDLPELIRSNRFSEFLDDKGMFRFHETAKSFLIPQTVVVGLEEYQSYFAAKQRTVITDVGEGLGDGRWAWNYVLVPEDMKEAAHAWWIETHCSDYVSPASRLFIQAKSKKPKLNPSYLTPYSNEEEVG